jgi:hypothetical protein
MVKRLFLLVIASVLVSFCHAQTAEAEQLLLDVQKLAQLKSILKNLYRSYEILSEGYEHIKSLSAGTYELHHGFLESLLEINSKVREYKPIVEAITLQGAISKKIQKNLIAIDGQDKLNAAEVAYIRQLSTRLHERNSVVVDLLTTILTPRSLRMSDDERMRLADSALSDTKAVWAFVQRMSDEVSMLLKNRAHALNEVSEMKDINDLK